MSKEEIEAKYQEVKKTFDKEKSLKSIIDRMALIQRRHGMEMPTVKGQVRAFLIAMEIRDLGFKAEDLK